MPKIITPQLLSDINVGFRLMFQEGFAGVTPSYTLFAMEVPSTAGEERYGWLGQFPKVREWIGDRVYRSLKAHGYSLVNRDFEVTVEVDRNDIEDDKLGLYKPMMVELGRAAAEHPDDLCYETLKAGFTTPCYDGQNFFDTDHPVVDANGTEQSVSNYTAGAGPAWFLMDLSRAVKPVIFQKRRPYEFQALDNPKVHESVFKTKKYVYGADGRSNAGFGLWQLAHASKAPLDETNLKAAWTSMIEMKGDEGRLLGIRPTHLVIPSSLIFTAKKLVENPIAANGATNELAGLVKVHDTPQLAA
ncbi:MAG: Mu-like prophage major head subunit gpT family protein [Rhodobiaceae bacterium]|nr:Mu-like prophage major head subunit gpT family protein [Rhodobiaceae bacterium]MCC0054332.1 Mu-like prophage major head subunit gpT family protein [Rhodobiaceae bacterium]